MASEAGLTQWEPPKPVHNPHVQVAHKEADVLSRYHWNVVLEHECWFRYYMLHSIASRKQMHVQSEAVSVGDDNQEKIVLSLSAISQGDLLGSQGLFSNHKHLEGLSRVFVCALAEPWHQIILTRNFNEGLARHQMSGAQ